MRTSILIALVAFGCSEGKRVTIQQSVGTSGGVVETGDGTAVNIPAGALAAQANITIESVNITPPSGVVQVGPAYDFGPEGSTFSTAVAITLPFAPDRIPTGRTANDVKIYTAPRGSSAFTTVGTVIEAGVLAKTTTTHFTTYFPGATSGAVTGDMAVSACKPSCSVQTGQGCECVASCSDSGSFQFTCMMETTSGPAFCTCKRNGVVIGSNIQITACDFESEQLAFMTKCAALP